MGELFIVYELMKRADGSVRGVGNSAEVTQDEAKRLVDAGTHKLADYCVGDYPADWNRGGSKKKVIEEEGINDGSN